MQRLALFLITFFAAAPSLAGTLILRPVSPGIFRGPRPGGAEEMQFISSQGVKTILNLQGRGPAFQAGESAEEIAISEGLATGLGLAYLKFPFAVGSTHILEEEERATVLAAVAVLQDPRQFPVYVHCFFGVDRTGIVIASFRILAQGCSFEKAREEMYRVGSFLTPDLTRGQLPFLQELEGRAGRPAESACPL